MSNEPKIESGEFEEFEGIQVIGSEDASHVAGGTVLLGQSMALWSSGIGYVTGPISLMVTLAGLFESLGWFKPVENANGPGSTISNITGGGNTGGSSGYVNGGGFGSDIRLKQNIRSEGELDALGVTVYSWEYKDAPGERFVGLMAQDLLARSDLKHAVFTFEEGPFAGFYGVQYNALGLAMLPVEAWDGDVHSLIVDQTVAA